MKIKFIVSLLAFCVSLISPVFGQGDQSDLPSEAAYNQQFASGSDPFAVTAKDAVANPSDAQGATSDASARKVSRRSGAHTERRDSESGPRRRILSDERYSDSVFRHPRYAEGGSSIPLERMKAGVWADELMGDRRALRRYDEFGSRANGFHAKIVELDPDQYVLVDMKSREALYDAGPCKNRLAPVEQVRRARPVREDKEVVVCAEQAPPPIFRGCAVPEVRVQMCQYRRGFAQVCIREGRGWRISQPMPRRFAEARAQAIARSGGFSGNGNISSARAGNGAFATATSDGGFNPFQFGTRDPRRPMPFAGSPQRGPRIDNGPIRHMDPPKNQRPQPRRMGQRGTGDAVQFAVQQAFSQGLQSVFGQR